MPIIPTQNKITPCLWFNNNTLQAVSFYVSVFKDSQIIKINLKDANLPETEENVITISFQIEGQNFLALNGGPLYTFSEAVSFMISCDSQAEIDEFWSKLSEDGQIQECGWLKDKFGVSWQIVPTILFEMMQSPDSRKVNQVLQAVWTMVKLDVEKLKQAYNS